MISIVIPAYNEENYIGRLLDSIQKQDADCDIVVADNHSRDNTRTIAKHYGAAIVDGGRPAEGRNNGAYHASHDLVFIDADTVLPLGFLTSFLQQVKNNGADIATCRVTPDTTLTSHRLFYAIKNLFNRLPGHVSGQCIFIKKNLFDELGGFDTSLYLAEEHDLARRAMLKGASFLFSDLHVLNAPRRIEKEGWLKLLVKSIYSECYRLFKREIHHPIYAYEFGNHD